MFDVANDRLIVRARKAVHQVVQSLHDSTLTELAGRVSCRQRVSSY